MRKIEKAFSHLNLKQKWEEKSRDGWKEETTNQKIIESAPYHIDSYEKLIDAIAQISFYNRDYALFYRGQNREYLDDSKCTKIFTQIYMKDDNYNLEELWEKLNETDRKLKEHFEAHYKKFAGTSIFLKYRELRWAIMQHYLVEKTPILDVTHSPYVAASFAQFKNEKIEELSMYWERLLFLIPLTSFQKMIWYLFVYFLFVYQKPKDRISKRLMPLVPILTLS